jgi:hypothetical protein
MLITRKSIFAVLIALFVLAGFGIASAAVVGGMVSSQQTPTWPASLSNAAVGTGLHNYVNPQGVGDTLLYNYYNTRNNYATFFTVTNTDSVNGVRARVRIREGADVAKTGECSPDKPLGSHELLDFDICLSVNDVFSAVLVQNPNDPQHGAMLCPAHTDANGNNLDTTLIWDGVNSHVFPKACVALKYGSGFAIPNITADMTNEGYMEIIAERNMVAEPTSCKPAENGGTQDRVGSNVGNVLFGNGALISMTPDGATFLYDATAIADFAITDVWQPTTTEHPTLADGVDGILGMNFILAKNELYSVYDLIGGSTEFVTTMPTKRLTQLNAGASCSPTQWTDDRVTLTFFDDNENSPVGQGCTFSPCPVTSEDHMPFEVNLIPANETSLVMDSTLTLPDQLAFSPYELGWFSLDLNRPGLTVAHANPYPSALAPAATAYGWPVMGLTLLDLEDGVSTAAFQMQYMTNVQFPQ